MEFAFTKKARSEKKLYEPTSTRQWIHHMLAEFFGTIWLSLGLAGLAAVTVGGEVAEHYLINPVIVGLYAGFIVVGSCLLFFLRWSCDLNPAVSTYRMITGANTYRYGFAKMAIQFVAAIIAGLMLYGMAKGNFVDNNPAKYEAVTPFNGADMLAGKNMLGKVGHPSVINGATVFMWVFFGELLITAILLWPIFTKSIKDKYRDLIICFVIAIDVMGAICFGTAAINPARGLTQQIPTLLFSHVDLTNVIISTVALILGGLAAPFFLVIMQSLTAKYINPLYTKGIAWKNVHHAKTIDFKEDDTNIKESNKASKEIKNNKKN